MADDGQVSFSLEDYDYDLPSELIAQRPSPVRDESRLLILDRPSAAIKHSRFDAIGQYLRRGDLLVVNDTRVVPARLTGRKETGGMVELLVLDPYKPAGRGAHEGYCCLAKASKGIREGQTIELTEGFHAEVISVPSNGTVQVRFGCNSGIRDIFEQIGRVPLPPYIKRQAGDSADDDRICYQTEYAKRPYRGSAFYENASQQAPIRRS
jgi:S-adenosylmethionine:tRNA ribosyltransferase-isomerase